jgi:hypothetical protein
VAYEEEKKLYRNTGQGHFVEATKSQGPDFRSPRVGRGLAVGDYDNDGWQDFLVSNNGQDAQLFHNDGGGPAFRPSTLRPAAGVRAPGADVDRGIVGAPPLEGQKGGSSAPTISPSPPVQSSPAQHPEEDRPSLRPKPRTTAPAQNPPIGDVPDASKSAPPAPRQGTASAVPKDAAAPGASAPEGTPSLAPGGVIDYRKGNDKVDSGVPSSDDVAVGRGVAGAPPFEPQKGGSSDDTKSPKNHWLAIRLIGTKSNRDGIGARLKLVAGDLISYDQSKGGMSYCSAQDPRIFFGLGSHKRADSLEIWWPSGAHESLTNLPVDVFLIIEEGSGSAKAVRYH